MSFLRRRKVTPFQGRKIDYNNTTVACSYCKSDPGLLNLKSKKSKYSQIWPESKVTVDLVLISQWDSHTDVIIMSYVKFRREILLQNTCICVLFIDPLYCSLYLSFCSVLLQVRTRCPDWMLWFIPVSEQVRDIVRAALGRAAAAGWLRGAPVQGTVPKLESVAAGASALHSGRRGLRGAVQGAQTPAQRQSARPYGVRLKFLCQHRPTHQVSTALAHRPVLGAR